MIGLSLKTHTLSLWKAKLFNHLTFLSSLEATDIYFLSTSDQVILTRHFLSSFVRHRHFFSHYYSNRLTFGIQRMFLPRQLILIALLAVSRWDLDLSTSFYIAFFPFVRSSQNVLYSYLKCLPNKNSLHLRLPFFKLEPHTLSFRKIYYTIKNFFA